LFFCGFAAFAARCESGKAAKKQNVSRLQGRNKDKKNKAMRESINPRLQTSKPKQQAKAESNLTDTEPAPGEK